MIETRMLSDWIQGVYPGTTKIIRAWLGPLEQDTVLARAGVTPRVLMPFAGGWADALILDRAWTRLVESKVVATGEAIGQLQVYSRLFKKTNEFKDRWIKPLIPVLLYAYPRSEALALAHDAGIETVHYCPDYISDYYREIAGLTWP